MKDVFIAICFIVTLLFSIYAFATMLNTIRPVEDGESLVFVDERGEIQASVTYRADAGWSCWEVTK